MLPAGNLTVSSKQDAKAQTLLVLDLYLYLVCVSAKCPVQPQYLVLGMPNICLLFVSCVGACWDVLSFVYGGVL
jgi:hypothetical protein